MKAWEEQFVSRTAQCCSYWCHESRSTICIFDLEFVFAFLVFVVVVASQRHRDRLPQCSYVLISHFSSTHLQRVLSKENKKQLKKVVLTKKEFRTDPVLRSRSRFEEEKPAISNCDSCDGGKTSIRKSTWKKIRADPSEAPQTRHKIIKFEKNRRKKNNFSNEKKKRKSFVWRE